VETHSDGPGVDRKNRSAPGLCCQTKICHRSRSPDPSKTRGTHRTTGAGLAGPHGQVLPERSEGSSPCAAELPQQPCIRSIPWAFSPRAFDPWGGSGAMMLSYASAAKLRAAGPFYSSGTRAMGGSGTPPPRIVIGNPAPASGAPNRCFSCLLPPLRRPRADGHPPAPGRS
jgi:hypothetical protein